MLVLAKATEQFFHAVQFSMLGKVLIFRLFDTGVK